MVGKLTKRLSIMWVLLAAEAAVTLRRHWQRVEPGPRRRLRELVAKSHGKPSNLTPAERQELRRLVDHFDLRALARDLGEIASPVSMPGRRRRRGG
jgi:hypothetical protein